MYNITSLIETLTREQQELLAWTVSTCHWSVFAFSWICAPDQGPWGLALKANGDDLTLQLAEDLIFTKHFLLCAIKSIFCMKLCLGYGFHSKYIKKECKQMMVASKGSLSVIGEFILLKFWGITIFISNLFNINSVLLLYKFYSNIV